VDLHSSPDNLSKVVSYVYNQNYQDRSVSPIKVISTKTVMTQSVSSIKVISVDTVDVPTVLQ